MTIHIHNWGNDSPLCGYTPKGDREIVRSVDPTVQGVDTATCMECRKLYLCLVDDLTKLALARTSTPGLTVHHAEDGCYLRFKASNGSEVSLNLNTIAADCGPLTEKILLQWIKDTKPEDQDAQAPHQEVH